MTPPSHAESKTHHREGGFTLIEVLIATAVATLLLVILFSIISETISVSRRTVQSLMAANSAATAMDVVAADLAGLMPLDGGAEYLVVDSETVDGLTNAYLRFLTASPNNVTVGSDTSPRSGQPGFVTYRVARYDFDRLVVSDSPVKPAYALFRVSSNGADSFTEMGASSINARVNTAPVMDDFFANNVVEFTVRALRGNTEVQTLNSLSLQGNNPTGSDRPDALLVTMVTLDDEGAERLREGVLSIEDIKTKYGRVLARRIQLGEVSNP